jgi:hypothetical protein
LEREGNLYNERITLGLGFIYFTTVSLIIYQLNLFYNPGGIFINNPITYALIFILLVTYNGCKALLIGFSGILFKTTEHTHAYRLNALIFNHSTGMILFPVLLITIYWKFMPFIWITVVIFFIMLIYKFIRSISIGLSNSKFSIFYLILYLCTLEILPVVLLVKIIRQLQGT